MFPELPQAILAVLGRVRDAGGHAYVVGGALRDAMLGKPPKDWDLAATLGKEALLELYPYASDIGGRFGTLRVRQQEVTFDITPCRVEANYRDRRHPEDLTFVPNIFLDLARRDFTVNAMAYDGEILLDPHGGQEDLEAKVLRCVGDARTRFTEDPLRILRMLRFSATLGFTVEWNTFTAARELAGGIASLSRERVYSEVLRILMSDGPQVLGQLITCGGLCGYGLGIAPSLAALAKVPKDPMCRWWALMVLCGADIDEVCTAFGFSRRHRAELTECSRLYALGPAHDKTELKLKLRGICLDYGPLSEAFAAVSPAFSSEPMLYGCVALSGEPYRLEHLAISGDMLCDEGIKGERCGEVLDELLLAVIKNPELNQTKVLLGMARGLRAIM